MCSSIASSNTPASKSFPLQAVWPWLQIGRRLGISAYRLNKVLEEAMLTLRSNHDLRQLVGAF